MAAANPRRFVLDASVAPKWVLPEPQAADAARLRFAWQRGTVSLLVPELWVVEVGNALWARTRRDLPLRLTRRAAARALGELEAAGLARHPHGTLTSVAFTLACDGGITVYDATYLALAIRENAPLITADHRLVSNTRTLGLADHVLPLRDIAATLPPDT